eukprot:CAMPEP_0197004484 /NCGR_PEP_ID=MMETSP1380-20130617/23210_1 /TAXON_ID=5936 /ORGANISM="Euplotes crassus, Strain CT5" /LENGTH=336 /DNA_ID=CAMNT_0042423291 /DNA_START=205 /DNA_END=1213 /DNA_ORIENTATION=+
MYFKSHILVVQKTILDNVPGILEKFFWGFSKFMEFRTQGMNGKLSLIDENFLEHKGISEILGIPTHHVMLTNFAYELFAYCTSIVAHDKNGEIIHARNMDYPLYQSMQNLTYTADFFDNGEFLFRSTMFAGYTGVFTAMKPGKFAISINERHTKTAMGIGVNILRFITGSYSPASLLKYTCRYAQSYNEAKEILSKYPLTAPVYLIVSGTEVDQGAIISRDRSGAADIWLINNHSTADWVIVQTNYDHWIKPSPASDKERANTAYHHLKNIGRSELDKENIVTDVLQIPQILNRGTIYSTVMQAKITGGHSTDVDVGGAYFKNYDINSYDLVQSYK